MLMPTRDYVDFAHVPADQDEIDRRLINWARWVRVRPHGWHTHAMWRNARTPKQTEDDARPVVALDTLDALLVEKAVSALPEKWRDAVRWSYVWRGDPAGMARKLGDSRQGLAVRVNDARWMLKNRLRTLPES